MKEKAKTKRQLIDELRNIRVRLAEVEKSESHEALKELMVAILDAIPLAVFGMKERRIIFANHAVETVFGWQPEELVGQSARILYRSDEDYEEIARRFYPALEQQRTHIDEFPCRRKDGLDIICVVSASRIGELLTERMIVVTYEDVTSRKRAEEEQRRLEKLQGVLEMAGTVCHEMNQPMQIISGYTELLLRNTSEDDPVYEKLNTIKKQIFRMATITKKLMMIRDYESRDYAGISRIIDIHGEDIELSEKKV